VDQKAIACYLSVEIREDLGDWGNRWDGGNAEIDGINTQVSVGSLLRAVAGN